MKTLFLKKSFIATVALIISCGAIMGLCASRTIKSTSSANPVMPTIVVDAGHGGIDNGVRGVNSETDEADINLAVAKLLRGQFVNAGFNCVMTRTTEEGLYGTTEKGFKARDMKKRKEIIASCDADIVISIHQNYCPLPSKRGGTVFFVKDNESGKALAQSIQTELNELNDEIKPNEILYGDYYMLKCTDNPSVIVECGFLSNAEDDKLLNTDEYRKELAYAIFKGAVTYLASNG